MRPMPTIFLRPPLCLASASESTASRRGLRRTHRPPIRASASPPHKPQRRRASTREHCRKQRSLKSYGTRPSRRCAARKAWDQEWDHFFGPRQDIRIICKSLITGGERGTPFAELGNYASLADAAQTILEKENDPLRATAQAMCRQCGEIVQHRLDSDEARRCGNGHLVAPTIARAELVKPRPAGWKPGDDAAKPAARPLSRRENTRPQLQVRA